ncbi:MAG: YjbH domain-containing protein [Armatimonadota bacterium]|nr:YjbH domain-containing protein [Armatimonadota bacterium]
MKWAIYPVMTASLVALVPGALQAGPYDDPASIPISVSRNGSTGLIRTSTADVMPDGDFEFSSHSALPFRPNPRIGDTANLGLNIGFLPRIEIGVQLGAPDNGEDLAVNAKYQVLPERGSVPAIAIGAFDIKNNFLPTTYYVAATRHFLNGRLSATVGGQKGGFSGGYGGLELGIVPHLSAMGEYDTRDFNYGVKAAFFNNRAMIYAQHVRAGWTLNLAGRIRLGTGESTPTAVTLPHLATPLDANAAVHAVQSRLIHMGLENVSVQITGDHVIQVSYENRSFPHTEMDALANALAMAAVYAPSEVTNLRVTALRQNNPIVEVACPLTEYRDFMAGKLDVDQFAEHFTANYTAHSTRGATTTAQSGKGNRSYGHTDLYVRPGARAQIATEVYTVGATFSVRPEIYVPLARGLDFDSISNIPIGGTYGIIPRNMIGHPDFQSPNPVFERAALGFTWHPLDSILTRSIAGKFADGYTGGYAEAFYLPGDTRWMLRGAVGVVNGGGHSQTETYTGRVRYYYPKFDLTAEAVAGRFLNRDTGYGIDLMRRFDQTDIGLQYRNTSIGKIGGIFVTLPIGPSHLSERPSFFRIRPADYFQYGQQTLLTQPNFTSVAARVANELRVGTPGITTTLDNGRLNPAYIRRSLRELRRARLFELGPQP